MNKSHVTVTSTCDTLTHDWMTYELMTHWESQHPLSLICCDDISVLKGTTFTGLTPPFHPTLLSHLRPFLSPPLVHGNPHPIIPVNNTVPCPSIPYRSWVQPPLLMLHSTIESPPAKTSSSSLHTITLTCYAWSGTLWQCTLPRLLTRTSTCLLNAMVIITVTSSCNPLQTSH